MKRLISVLVVVTMSLFVLCGCKVYATSVNMNRFEKIYKQRDGASDVYTIIKDTETGVLYMAWWGYSAGGMTVLVDENGKPLVMKQVIIYEQ